MLRERENGRKDRKVKANKEDVNTSVNLNDSFLDLKGLQEYHFKLDSSEFYNILEIVFLSLKILSKLQTKLHLGCIQFLPLTEHHCQAEREAIVLSTEQSLTTD